MEKDNSVSEFVVHAVTHDKAIEKMRNIIKECGSYSVELDGYVLNPMTAACKLYNAGYRPPSTDREAKALAVIEGVLIKGLLVDEPVDKRILFIYRMAHIGRGECEHKEWEQELEGCYQELIKGNIISPPSDKPSTDNRREAVESYLADFIGVYSAYVKGEGSRDNLKAKINEFTDQILSLWPKVLE